MLHSDGEGKNDQSSHLSFIFSSHKNERERGRDDQLTDRIKSHQLICEEEHLFTSEASDEQNSFSLDRLKERERKYYRKRERGNITEIERKYQRKREKRE